MNIEFSLHFEKDMNSKIEEWRSTYSTSNDSSFLDNFQSIMQTFQESELEIKKIKHFSKFIKLVIVQKYNTKFNGHNDAIVIRSINNMLDNSFINLEYLLKFDWNKINKITLCKIIKTNFSNLMYNLNQEEKNRINNISKMLNESIEDTLIKNFKTPKINVIEKIDAQNIKNYTYKTPVKYRNT